MENYSFYNDASLVQLLNKGDEKAFTEIYNRYWQKLLVVGANKLSSHSEAEEIVQDIFLDLWNRQGRLQVTGQLSAYLATAVKYRVINVLAKRNRAARYKTEVSQATGMDQYSSEEWVSFKEVEERLSRLVAALPDKCQVVYKLRKEEGYPQKKVAEILQISEKAVESHLTRAVRSLRNSMRELFYNLLA